MKTQLKNFWNKPHLTLGNSFMGNGKEVQRRLQMSLKQKSPRLKMMYGLLGLVLCVLVASAFKINIQKIPSFIEENFVISQKPLRLKVDKTIPSIKITAVNTVDTSSYLVVKDANDNILNPDKVLQTNPVWIEMKHPKYKKVKIVKMAVQLFYNEDNTITETQYFLGNKVDWSNFKIDRTGNISIQVTEILVNNEIIKLDTQDTYKVIFQVKANESVHTEVDNKESKSPNTAFLGMANLPLYKSCEHNLFLELEGNYNQENLSYKVNQGAVKKGEEKGEVWVIPEQERNLNLQIYSQGKLLKKHSFKVRRIPKPTAYLANSEGIKLNANRYLLAEDISLLKVMVKADETFEAIFPQDAKYKVFSVEITQFSEGRSVKSLRIENETRNSFLTIDMSAFELKTGDGFNIKITRIHRTNIQGQAESAPISRPNLQFTVRVPDIEKE